MARASSWLSIPEDSHFSLLNIPFGIITTADSSERGAAIAIGDHVLILGEFARHGGFAELPDIPTSHIATLSRPTLNDFAALGQGVHTKVRKYLQSVFAVATPYPRVLRDNLEAQQACLVRKEQVTVHLPMEIRGYTDFFAGKNHAYNCGCIFRDPAKALNPNYLQLPVAYNSRASSVGASPAKVRRPLGQYLTSPSAEKSSFGPCRRLDIELELGALLCRGNELGEPVGVDEAESYIFGFVLLNDWSARDIQAFEAVPLGPFNAKTFATTVSPWVVLRGALEPFRTPSMENVQELHPYLRQARKDNVYDISLSVNLTGSDGETATLSQTNGRNLVYSFAQMIAHQTIGGCPVEVGDLIGSGTISGTAPGTLGSLLEASDGGKRAYALSSSLQRMFLEDGDCVTIKGWCGNRETGLVGFGECMGTIIPAHSPPWLKERSQSRI